MYQQEEEAEQEAAAAGTGEHLCHRSAYNRRLRASQSFNFAHLDRNKSLLIFTDDGGPVQVLYSQQHSVIAPSEFYIQQQRVDVTPIAPQSARSDLTSKLPEGK